MISTQPARPYFEAWLRRAGRQLAASGRLSQIAWLLAREDGGSPTEWRVRLRRLLDGDDLPSLELLTRLDALLAGPSKTARDETAQAALF